MLFSPSVLEHIDKESAEYGSGLEARLTRRFRIVPVGNGYALASLARSFRYGFVDPVSVFFVIGEYRRPRFPVELRISFSGIERNAVFVYACGKRSGRHRRARQFGAEF